MTILNRDLFRAANIDPSVKSAMEGFANQADNARAGAREQFKYNTNAATSAVNLTAANVTGGSKGVSLNMTGTLAAGANATLPLAADIIAAIPNAMIGQTYLLTLMHTGAGAFAWTVVTNTGITLAGTLTVAQNTQRTFLVTMTGAATLTMQSLGAVGVTGL